MNRRKILVSFVVVLSYACAANGVEINGKIAAVSGDTTTIALDGDVLPSVGDKVDVFFRIGNAEVSVGSGKITEATSGSIKAKIDNATGSVIKDHLVRIKSDKSPKPSAVSAPPSVAASAPAPAPPPSASPVVTNQGKDPSFAFADMNRIFREYPRTKDSETKINQAKNAAKAEYDQRVAQHVSASELQAFRATREKDLQEQALKMRTELVGEITSTVKRLAGNATNLVLDMSGITLNGVPVFMYIPPAANMSEQVGSSLKGQQPFPVQPMRNLKLAFVNMNDVFKRCAKTATAEAEINAAKNAAKNTYDQRAASYKKELARVESLFGAARDKQIAKVKKLEGEINGWRATKEQGLQAQALKKREAIVADITKAVGAKLVAENSVLVMDSSGNSLNGVPLIIFSQQIPDFSDEVVSAVNGSAGKISATTTPLASTSELRLACIDMDRAFKAIPETAAAEAEINALRDQAKAELATAASDARQAKEKELGEFAAERRQPIVNKITAAVRQLGTSAGYNLIFDSSGQSLNGVPFLVSVAGMPDLTEELIARTK